MDIIKYALIVCLIKTGSGNYVVDVRRPMSALWKGILFCFVS